MELDVDGRRITIHTQGTGSTLVCLPGGPGFPAAQLGDLGGLARDRSLLVPDWRGAGESDPPADGRHGVTDYVADLERIHSALGLDRVDLFGHSFGGIVAATYAAEHSGVVGRLVLDGTPDVLDDRAPAGDGLRGFFARWDETTAAYAEAVLAGLFQPAVDWFGEHEYDGLEIRSALSRIDAPTLVVTGDRDWACGPACAQDMVGLLPAGEAAVIPEAGHFAWVEQPQAYAAAVLAFLDGRSDC